MSTEKQEIQMFGCTLAELEQGINNPIAKMVGGHWMTVASIMSDAQELISMGRSEEARQFLNRGKWIISKYLAPNR